MSQSKVAKSKGRQEKPKLRVMHYVSKDENGAPTIASRQLDPNPPKLRKAVAPKSTKTEKLKDKPKDELSDEQRSILQALHDLGGKDVHSMDIAKKLGVDKKYPKAPRAPVRNAMDKLHALHYVTSKKEGVKYSFRITDKGIEALKAKPNPTAPRDKEAVPAVEPASSPSAPSSPFDSRGIECAACKTENPPIAVHCKNCGTQLRAVQLATAAS